MRVACMLDKVLCHEILIESTQHNVIGHEAGIIDHAYGVDGSTVAPNGIGTHCRNSIRFHHR